MINASRRIAAILAAVLTGVLGVATAAAQSEHEKQLYDGARKEGQLTWYTAHYDQALATKIGNAFTQKYPGVQANVIKATAQVSFQRLLQDIKAGQVQCDVFSSTDVSHFAYLKQKGDLEKYVPENEGKIVPAFQKIDPDGFSTVTWAGLVAISTRTRSTRARRRRTGPISPTRDGTERSLSVTPTSAGWWASGRSPWPSSTAGNISKSSIKESR